MKWRKPLRNSPSHAHVPSLPLLTLFRGAPAPKTCQAMAFLLPGRYVPVSLTAAYLFVSVNFLGMLALVSLPLTLILHQTHEGTLGLFLRPSSLLIPEPYPLLPAAHSCLGDLLTP